MKLTLKEKARLFWERNKTDIIGWLVGAGVITGFGCAVVHYTERKEKERKAVEDMVRAMEDAKQAEEARKAEEEEKRISEDPANQLTAGGYVAPRNDNLYEADCPNLLANCVPLTSMGQFGQDIIDRYKQEWPNWEEVGMFNPETAVADVYVDFCHEKWLEAQRAAEAESQEKQAS